MKNPVATSLRTAEFDETVRLERLKTLPEGAALKEGSPRWMRFQNFLLGLLANALIRLLMKAIRAEQERKDDSLEA